MLLLEPRVLLDAAAVVTIDHVADNGDHDTQAEVQAHQAPPAAPEPGHDQAEPGAQAESLEPAAMLAPPAERRTDVAEIVFIDSRVRDAEQLVGRLDPDAAVVWLEADRDGLAQISETLAGYGSVGAVRILSHGDGGTVFLGNREVNAWTLLSESDQVAGWADALSADADILLYGCDVGRSDSGEAFVATLADLTGADVAASDDATGSSARGGNWTLEATSGGSIEAAAFDGGESYGHVLAVPNAGGDVTVTDPSGAAVAIQEDAAAPGAANVRLSVPNLFDPDGSTPGEIRILSVDGGTLTDADGNAITLGSGGTRLALDSGHVDLRFTPDANRDSNATFQYVVVDPDDTASNSAASTATIQIQAVNDAPSAGGAATVTDTAGAAVTVPEDASAPGAANIQLTVPTLSDLEGPAPTQIRILSVDGGTLTDADGNAITLGASGTQLTLTGNSINLRFTPAANRDSNASFQYVVVDADGSLNSAASTVTVPIQAANDAPDLGGNAILAPIAEDIASGSNSGVTVADLVTGSGFTDVDSGAASGVAVVGANDGGGGSWQFSTDGGATWTGIGAASDGNALLLANDANTRVRFQPNADFNGTVTLSLRAWDQTSGASGQTVSIAATGGETAFGASTRTATQVVTAVNDAPVLESGVDVVLPAIVEDIADLDNAGFAVAALITVNGQEKATDVDGDGLGIAVTALGGLSGTWQYSTDGTTWTDVGTVSAGQALLLSSAAKLRFRPDSNLSGEATLSYAVWDGSQFTEGSKVDASTRGGTTPFSLATATASQPVSPVNDAPSVASAAVSFAEGQAYTLLTGDLMVTDPDNTSEQLIFRIESLPSSVRITKTIGGTEVTATIGALFSYQDVADGLIKFRYTGGNLSGDYSAGFTYSVRDGAGGELTGQAFTVTVTDVNAQISVSSTQINVSERVGSEAADFTTLSLTTSDADGDAALITYTIGSLPNAAVGRIVIDKGAGFVDAAIGDTITQADVNAGKLRFLHTGSEPEAALASTSFTVSVTDGNQTETPTTAGPTAITLNVVEVNDPPAQSSGVAPAMFTVAEGGSGVIGGQGAGTVNLDIDDPDSVRARVTYTIRSGPSEGAIYLDGVRQGVGATFTQADVDNGLVEYRHEGGEPANGSPTARDDFFTYTMRDGDGAAVDGTFDINVTPLNDPGVDTIGRISQEVGTTTTLGGTILVFTDADTPATGITYTIDAGTVPANARFELSTDPGNATLTFTQDDIDNGRVSFVHTGGAGDAGSYSVSFTVSDGTTTSQPQQLPIVLLTQAQIDGGGAGDPGTAGGNTPGITANSRLIVSEGSTGTVISNAFLAAGDADTAAGSLTYTVTTAPANGTLFRDGVALSAGSTFTQADVDAGLIAYSHLGSETTADSFVFDLSDGDGDTPDVTGRTFSFLVTPVNDQPGIVQTQTTLAVAEADDVATDFSSEDLSGIANAVLITADNFSGVDPDSSATQLVYVIDQLPGGGTIRIWNGTAWVALAAGGRFTQTQIADGHLAYFHNGGEPNAATDLVKVRLTDQATNPNGSESSSAQYTLSFNVGNVNDAPVTQSNSFTLAEGGTRVLDGTLIEASDADDTQAALTYRILSLPTRGTLVVDGVTLTAGDLGTAAAEFTRAQLDANLISYVHGGGEFFTDSFTYTASDDEPATGNTSTVSISITPVNDPPSIVTNTGLPDTVAYEGETATITTAMLNLADPDNSSTQVQVRLTSAVQYGRLVIDNGGGDVKTLGVGSAFTLQDLIDGKIKYLHNNTENHTDGFSFTVSDGSGGTEPAATFNINVGPVNDSPILTAPTAVTVNEDTAVVITGFSVSDIDVAQTAAGTLTMTFGVSNGTLQLVHQSADGTSGTFSVTGNGTGTLTVTGTAAELTAALASGVRYQGSLNFNDLRGTESMSVTLSDAGNSGRDPGDAGSPAIVNTPNTGDATAQVATATVAISVRPVNDRPGMTYDGSDFDGQTVDLAVAEDTDLALDALVVTDIEAQYPEANGVNDGTLQVTLTASTGTLTVQDSGLSAATVGGSGGSAVTITGTKAQIDALLVAGNLVYRAPQDYGGPATITVVTSDRGNEGAGGVLLATGTLAVTVSAVNDPPVIEIPAGIAGANKAQLAEDGSFTFGGANRITVADVDAGANLQVTLTLSNLGNENSVQGSTPGTLTLATTSGVTVTGNGTGALVLTGTAAAINAAMNGMVYAPAANDYGTFRLTIVADDQGNAGSGGAQSDTETVDIRVTSVDDAPVVSVGGSALSGTAASNGGIVVLAEDAGWSDVKDGTGNPLVVSDLDLTEDGAGSTLTVTLSLPSGNGDLRFDADPTGDGVTVDSVTGVGTTAGFTSVTISGTAAQINAALARLEYQPDANFNTQYGSPSGESLRVVVLDNGHSAPAVDGVAGSGAPQQITRDLPITVSAVNDAPVLATGDGTSFAHPATENDALAITGLSVSDVDLSRGEGSQSDPLQVTLSAAGSGATLTLGTTTGLQFSSGANGQRSFTIRGTLSEINAALATLSYRSGEDPGTSDTITVTVNDRGNRGTGGTLTDSATITVTGITPQNDAPTITRPAAVTASEDVAFAFTGANAISIADVDVRANAVDVTLSVPEGTLTLATTAGLTVQAGANGSGTITLRGSLSDLNAALATLTYLGASNRNAQNVGGTVALSISVDDRGYGENDAAAGVSGTDSETVAITLSPVNDQPDIAAATGSFSVGENATVAITGVTVSDAADADNGGYTTARVSLGVSFGTLDFTSATAGVTVSGAGGKAVTLTGSLADLNSALAKLTYTPDTDYTGADSLSLSVSDLGNVGSGNVLTDSASIALTVGGANDAPVFSGPTTATVDEDATVTFSAGNGNRITVADADSPTQELMVRITVTNGTASLGTTSGLDFAFTETSNAFGADGGTTAGAGDGTADATMTFKGTLAEINAALDGLTYAPTGDFNGPATLTILVSDLGNTGTGGVQETTRSVAITVAPINDAPVASGSATLGAIAEDTADPPGATVSSLVTARFDDSTDTVAGGSTAHSLAGVAIVGNAATSAQGAWQYSTDGGTSWTAVGSRTAGTALLLGAGDLVRFLPAANFNGSPGALSVKLVDSSSGAVTGAAVVDLSAGGATGGTTAYSAASVAIGTSVTGVNNAPVASDATLSVAEDSSAAGSSVTTLFAGSFDDSADAVTGGSAANALAGVAIVGNAATAGQGAWQYSTDGGTSWSAVGTRADGNALLLKTTDLVRFLPAGDWNGTPGGLSFRVIDDSSGVVTTGTQDLSAATGGITAISGNTATLAGTVTAANDAPVASGSATLAAVSEDAGDPAGATVTSLVAGNFSDATDTVAGGSTAHSLAGVAIVGNAATSAQGAWQYSTDGGTSWTAVGSRTAATALLLQASDLVRFLPAAHWNGTPGALTVNLIDSSSGAVTGGATADLSSGGATGGTTAYSAATVALGTSVTAVNDAPVASGSATLASVAEDAGDPAGATVTSLVSGNFSDATDTVAGGSAAHSLAGVAIVGNAATSAQGAWQYSTDGGTSWTAVGSRTAGTALLLGAGDLVRFLPAAHWNGTPGALTVNLIDSSAGAVTGGATADLSSGGATGGTTAYSAATVAIGTAVTAVNDAPTATGNASLTVAEDDGSASGSTVTTLFGTLFSDATDQVTGGSAANGFAGVAIVGNAATAGQGTWQYSTDGGTSWTAVGTRAVGNALLLKTSDRVRFVPAADFNGAVGALTYRTIDDSAGAVTSGTQDISGSTGGTTAFGGNTALLNGTVTAVNDAPVASGSATLASVAEDAGDPAGATVTSLVSGNFSDTTDTVTGGSAAHSLAGVAIVGNAANSAQGAWQYSTDGGTNWTAVGSRTDATALLLQASDLVRFLPAAHWNGTPGALTVNLIDSSAGALSGGATADLSSGGATGGTTAYSAATVAIGTAVTAVNDAPTATGNASLTVAEDDGSASGSTVTTLFGTLFSDATDQVTGGSAANGFAGVAIVGNAATAGQGTWQHSTDGGTSWTAVGTRAVGNALLLKTSDRVRFVPAADFNGAVGALTYRTIDDSAGAVTSGTQDISGSTGGTTAFGGNTALLNGTVTAVNDAPVASGSATLASVAEDAGDPAGATVTSLVSGNFSDTTDTVTGGSAAHSLAGVAIVGNAANSAQGAWQYSTDGGTNWTAVGSRTDATALLLQASDLVRFLPAAHWNGTPGALTVNLIDSSSGAVTGGATADLSSGGATGGTTAYSAATVALGTSVTAVNDAPVASGSATLASVAEDAGDPAGATVTSLVSGNFSDATDTVAGGSAAHSLAGVAIVGNAATSAQGAWQYSTDGGTSWTAVGSRTAGTALLLGAGDLVRFLPAAHWNGTPGALTVNLIDSSAGAVTGGATADLSSGGATGGTTAYSAATVAIGTAVTAVNDAPTATGTATLATVAEDSAAPAGATVSALVSGTFGDPADQVTGGSLADALAGIAIVGNAATAGQGTWQYSTDGGTSWSAVGTRTDATALLLGTSDLVRFLPAGDWNGTPGSLSYRTVDSSSGAVTGGSTTDLSTGGATGGTTAVSAGTASLATAVTAVNDAPVASGSATLASISEDAGDPAGATVTSLVSGNFSDATDTVAGGSAAHSLAGVAIVGNAANSAQGAWQYSTDGGTSWTAVGSRTAGTALLLQASDLVRFLPAAHWNGTPGALTVNLIDSSAGAVTGGATADLSSGGATGGTTAYSAATVAIGTAVTAVNDAPVATGSATLTGVSEGVTNPPGATVAALVSGNFGDTTDSVTGGSSAHSLAGIAIVGYTPVPSEGAWQYSTDGGTTWTDVGTRTSGSALLLDAAAKLRFLPEPTYHGTPTGLTVSLIDSSAGAVAGGTAVDLSAVGATGGTTPHSAATLLLGTTVGAVNDPPVNTVPAAQVVVEDGTLVFSSGNGNALSVADADLAEAGGPTGLATVTLSVAQGTLTVTAVGHGASVSNDGSASVTLRGTAAQLNAALEGLTYRPGADYSGADSLTMATDDEGNSGSGGARTDSDSVAITVTPAVDRPTLSVAPASGNEDSAIPLSITAGFLDSGSGSQEVVVSGIPAGSVLGTGSGAIAVPGGGSVSLTPAQLAGLTITPPADSDVDFTLTVTARSTVGGVALEQQATLTVQVAAVADVPVALTVPAPITVAQGGSAAAAIAASLTDLDGSEALTYRLSGIPSGMTFVNGAGQSFSPSGGSLTLSRAQAQGLAVSAGSAAAGSYTIDMVAISTEAVGGSTAEASSSFQVTVTATGGTGPGTPPPPAPPPATPPASPGPAPRGFPAAGPGIPAPAGLTVGEAVGGDQGGDTGGLLGTGGGLFGSNQFGAGSDLFGGGLLGGEPANLTLTLTGQVSDQVLLTTVTRQFQVPEGTFRHTDPQAPLIYEAGLAGGDPLPNWLSFDPQSLTFTGTPPVGTEGTLEIALTARDPEGNEATASFRLIITRSNENTDGEPPPPQGPIAETETQQGELPAVPQDGDSLAVLPGDGAAPGTERFADQSQLAAEELGLLPIRWLPADAEASALVAQAEPPAGRSGFTMQLHDAGRGGLYAEARALLESLKRAAETERGDISSGGA